MHTIDCVCVLLCLLVAKEAVCLCIYVLHGREFAYLSIQLTWRHKYFQRITDQKIQISPRSFKIWLDKILKICSLNPLCFNSFYMSVLSKHVRSLLMMLFKNGPSFVLVYPDLNTTLFEHLKYELGVSWLEQQLFSSWLKLLSHYANGSHVT